MKKLMSKKGFTLMEMLIVVAIIVILVAISIPTFSSSLDDAKAATDAANLRAAKGVAEIADMSPNGWKTAIGDTYTDEIAGKDNVIVYYDIESGKYTLTEITEGYGQSSENKGEVITVELDKGVMTVDPAWN